MNITSPSLAVLSGVHVVATYFHFRDNVRVTLCLAMIPYTRRRTDANAGYQPWNRAFIGTVSYTLGLRVHELTTFYQIAQVP